MRRRAVLLALAGVACVTGTEPDAVNPVPFVLGVSPDTLPAGSGARTVEVRGERFVPGSTALWNGTERLTSDAGDGLLTVEVEATDLALPGTAEVRIRNPGPGGGLSEPWPLVLATPAPRLDSVSPDSAVALVDSMVAVDVFGTGFTDYGTGSRVLVEGTAVETQVLSSTRLAARVPLPLLRAGRTGAVRVSNPDPGGRLSTPVPFTVFNPLPTATAVVPDSILIGATATVTVAGSGFVEGAAVYYDSVRYEPRSVRPDSIVFEIPGGSVARGGGSIRVSTPGPGGGSTGFVNVGIRERAPRLRSLNRYTFEVGGGAAVLEAVADDLAPDAVMTLDGQPRPTTVVGNRAEIVLQPDDRLSVGVAEVRVENPRGGGGSNPDTITVVPPGSIVTDAIGGVRRWRLGEPVDSVIYDHPELGSRESLQLFPHADSLLVVQDMTLAAAPREAPRVVTSERLQWPRVSADGWIYYVLGREIWRISLGGGPAEGVLTSPGDSVLLRWPEPSPTGDRIAYARYVNAPTQWDDLLILELQTSAVTSLGLPAHQSSWSPDGEWIAYRDPSGNLMVVRPDGSGNRMLLEPIPRWGPWHPATWSPDSEYVLVGLSRNRLMLIHVASGERIPVRRTAYPGGPVHWQRTPSP